MAAARSLQSLSKLSKSLQLNKIQAGTLNGFGLRRSLYLSESCSQCRRLTPPLGTQLASLPTSQRLQQQQQFLHGDTLTKKDIITRIAEKIGYKGKLRYRRGALQRAGVRMYLCAVELVDYNEFFQELGLPDTFNSWFRITELHIWMCAVRLVTEEREGTLIRNNMLKNLWDDCEKRTKKIGEMASSSGRREGINQLSQEFRANLYGYDEGLLSDDRVLAGAVWRNFFETKCEDPEKLEKMVHYIRRQVSHLENQTSERVVGNGILTFVPFTGDKIDIDRTKAIVGEILNRS